MRCFLDDLRAFGINADQRTTAAQDEGEWRRTAEQGAEHFMVKWIAAEKVRAGLRYAVVRPNETGRTKKRTAQSKPARAGLLTLVNCQVATSGANSHTPGVEFADVLTSSSGVTFVNFWFVFAFMLLLKPRPFVQSFFDMQAPR